jgi:hypothetical protein
MATKRKVTTEKYKDENPITTYSINKEILNTYTQISECTLNNMISQLDYGNYDEAVRIKDKLLQDDRLNAVLNAREFNLLDAAISVTTDILSQDNDIKIIQDALNVAEQEIKDWFGTSLLLGVGLLQIIYSKDDFINGKRNIKLQNYKPHGLRYDLKEDLYFLITSYKDQSDESTNKRINELKNSKGYVSLEQYRQNYDVEIITNNPKWIICKMGDGLIRSLCWTYLNKQLAVVDKNKWNNKTAGVIKKLLVPAQADPAANKAFARSVKNMVIDDVVTLPQTADGPNYDVSYLEAGAGASTAYQSYENTIAESNADYAIAILSNNLTTQVTTGSQAASTTHAEKEYKLAKSDKEFIQAIFNKQLIESYKLVNTPDLKCNIIINKNTEAETIAHLGMLQTISDVNNKLKEQGMELDIEKLIGTIGIDWVKKIGAK